MKPKILAEIQKNNTGKKSDIKNHTEHFLINGEMMDGRKKELKDQISYNIKGNIIIRKYKDMLRIGLESRKDDISEFLEGHGIIYNQSTKVEEFNISKFDTYIKTIRTVLEREFGIIVNDGVVNGKVYKVNDDGKIAAGESLNKLRKIMLLNSGDHVVIHELVHHITQLYIQIINLDSKNFYFHTLNGYSYIFLSKDNNENIIKVGNVINEGITEIVTYKILKELNKGNTKLMNNDYSFYIFVIAKLIDLANKKLSLSKEYIYKHIIRGYFIKGYKGLSIFYKAFGREFVRSLMKIHTSDESIGISQYYEELGFENKEQVFEYFDIKNLPSQEISDIIGIER